MNAVADDFTDLVSSVVKGPDLGSDLSGMVKAVTGKGEKKSKKRVGVNMEEILGSMSEVEKLGEVAQAMTMTSVLNAATLNNNYFVDKNQKPTFTMPTTNMGNWMPYGGGDPTFFRPVSGRITSRFGYRHFFGRMHKGVDLHLNVGDTVKVAMSGTVDYIGYDPDGYGNYIVVKHSGDMETLYGHLQRSLVVKGQYLRGGDPLALGGNSGNSTGPHLHFEARLMGVAMDPLLLFDFKSTISYRGSILASGDEDKKETLHTGFHRRAASLADQRTYVVKAGDTVEAIAARAGISVSSLCRLNLINTGDKLQEGRMLKLR